MKLVLFDDYKPGLLKGDGVVDISSAVQRVAGRNGQETMEGIITNLDSLREGLARLLAEGKVTPLSSVRLRAPLPRPSKILCMIGNYKEGTDRPIQPIDIFLKSSDSVLDPGGTVVIPPVKATIFHHEAELGLVIGRKGKDIKPAQAFDYIIGYTAFVDVSARGTGRGNSFSGKSYDTFAPLGPCIATKDEIPDPHKLAVKLWVGGQIRHDYNTDDMEHQIPEIIEYASSIMTLNPGDLIACGTNHQGLGPLQDGETATMEVSGIGRFTFKVSDPSKRTWPVGVDVESARAVRERTGAPGAAR